MKHRPYRKPKHILVVLVGLQTISLIPTKGILRILMTKVGENRSDDGFSGNGAAGDYVNEAPDHVSEGEVDGDTETIPVTAYVQQYLDETSQYPVQEVIPNTSVNMNMYRRKRGNTVTSNVLPSRFQDGFYNQGSLASNNNGGIQNAEDAEGATDDNNVNGGITMMVKPKTLYQNPQTPTVLPSTYYPINKWSSFKYKHLKEFFGEFLGTMVMMMLGTAAVCQTKLSEEYQIRQFNEMLVKYQMSEDQISLAQYIVTPNVAGNALSIYLGWAGAVVMGYFAAGGSAISGAHLNPCITISNIIFRGFPSRKIGIYLFGQYLGSYVGSLIIFWYYHQVIIKVYPDWKIEENVMSMFGVKPLDYLSVSRQFISEFVVGALLQCGMFSLTDPYTCLSTDLFPVMLFILIFTLNASASYQTGAALNPARDMGPRLALLTVGMSKQLLFRSYNFFFWVPMFAPLVGTICGAIIYDFCIYQGHESPMNLPLSTYTDWVRRQWEVLKIKSSKFGLSDAQTIESLETSSTIISHRIPSMENKQVHFKSVLRNTGLRNPSRGVPTIFESEETTYTRPNFFQRYSDRSTSSQA